MFIKRQSRKQNEYFISCLFSINFKYILNQYVLKRAKMDHNQHQGHQHTQHNDHSQSHSDNHQNKEWHWHHKPKQKDHFNAALMVIFLAIFISLIGFMSANDAPTGFVVSEEAINSDAATQTSVKVFENIKGLEALAPGNYYIDGQGYVYWMDDDSTPAVAKVTYIRDEYKYKRIYIDNNGNVGYLI